MPVERPTFSESWYRVANLRPRLRSTVQVHRQHFRGQMWHVVQDPSSNQFFRLNEAAYHFVAMLDGRRTVAEAWHICNEELGDNAPTQGEAIQLLGQLYTSNLLHAELPPDAEGLFKRHRKRIRREVQGYMMNLLFIRIPLLDPDHFLNRWVSVFGRLFTVYGFIAWAVIICVGLYFLGGRFGDLADRASGILDPENLPLLYLSFIFIKIFHEFGHAFACKRFGRITGTGGEVHTMGVMFLVFTPLPYVDASSAWAFRKKTHRVVVGAGGMLVELAIAAIAAVVWASTSEGTTIHAITYNMMFIASVSTILFNANPLLRFDGYYILSDILEIPNLAQRSKQYLYYLVKRYAWRVKQARNPAHTAGERGWLAFYAVASTIYRVIICVGILLFVANKLFFLGAILAVAAFVAWVLVPLGKFVRYLATSGELARVRARAVVSTVMVILLVVGGIGLIPAPDRDRVEGVVEPVGLAVVYMDADGFVIDYLPSGTIVTPDGSPLLCAMNPELEAHKEGLLAERKRLKASQRLAQAQEEMTQAQILGEQIQALDEQINRVEEQLSSLEVHAPLAGTWLAPDIDRARGAYLRRGEGVGLVASLDRVLIRATAGQQEAAMLIDEADKDVKIIVKNRPDTTLSGTIVEILPAGQEQLPSAALGYAAGGSVATSPGDPQGTKAAERFFEIRISPNETSDVRLLSGQRVVVQFEKRRKPLMVQWWRSLLQLLQKRLHI